MAREATAGGDAAAGGTRGPAASGSGVGAAGEAAARSAAALNGGAAAAETIAVRALATAEEYVACVQLQRATWGESYGDCVPASLLKLAARTGGVAGGAFTADGRLIGFVYGLTGVRDGVPFHWSHMLAVLPEYRNSGLGSRLKAFQRATLRGSGIDVIHWTFDPLVARNAHLNLNKLGARVIEYVPDMYGDTGSDLHAFGTDRFVVAWSIDPEARRSPGMSPEWRAAPIVGGLSVGGTGGAAALDPADGATQRSQPVVRIEIPPDVERLDVAQAREWRAATRAPFVAHLLAGYEVVAFYSEGGRAWYVLSASS